MQVPAGETRVFAWKLRGVESGMFRGDVDVCEGMQFLTSMAQTRVVEAE
jgi:hypothetical protein